MRRSADLALRGVRQHVMPRCPDAPTPGIRYDPVL
jgi:hypothetical protein